MAESDEPNVFDDPTVAHECQNAIMMSRDKKIVLYKIDWLDYYNVAAESKDEFDISYINGKTVRDRKKKIKTLKIRD